MTATHSGSDGINSLPAFFVGGLYLIGTIYSKSDG